MAGGFATHCAGATFRGRSDSGECPPTQAAGRRWASVRRRFRDWWVIHTAWPLPTASRRRRPHAARARLSRRRGGPAKRSCAPRDSIRRRDGEAASPREVCGRVALAPKRDAPAVWPATGRRECRLQSSVILAVLRAWATSMYSGSGFSSRKTTRRKRKRAPRKSAVHAAERLTCTLGARLGCLCPNGHTGPSKAENKSNAKCYPACTFRIRSRPVDPGEEALAS